jgi:thioredoxin-dependent peroxiredoxin
MSSFSRRAAIATIITLVVGTAMPQTKPYPKPQVSSASGQIAPDFTLKDQDGKDFKLADQRGHWVLLFFYRGYW